jgi:hypothetical protein
MDAAYLSAISALGGSVVGAFTSGFTTWLSQRTQAKAGQIAREMARRDELYKDFIIAASKAYGDALVNSEPQVEDLIVLYAMVSRMRSQSTPRTVACAEKVMLLTIDANLAPAKTIRERAELLRSGTERIDPLKDFSEAAREELLAFSL